MSLVDNQPMAGSRSSLGLSASVRIIIAVKAQNTELTIRPNESSSMRSIILAKIGSAEERIAANIYKIIIVMAAVLHTARVLLNEVKVFSMTCPFATAFLPDVQSMISPCIKVRPKNRKVVSNKYQIFQ